jgi:hypothetical protein
MNMDMELASLLGFKNTPAYSSSRSLSGEDVSIGILYAFKMPRKLSGGVFPFLAVTTEIVSLSIFCSTSWISALRSGVVLIPKEKTKIKIKNRHKT